MLMLMDLHMGMHCSTGARLRLTGRIMSAIHGLAKAVTVALLCLRQASMCPDVSATHMLIMPLVHASTCRTLQLSPTHVLVRLNWLAVSALCQITCS